MCKEFVAAQADERGVLLLSPFVGATHESSDALIMNPHHTPQAANALNHALRMSADEQMQSTCKRCES